MDFSFSAIDSEADYDSFYNVAGRRPHRLRPAHSSNLRLLFIKKHVVLIETIVRIINKFLDGTISLEHIHKEHSLHEMYGCKDRHYLWHWLKSEQDSKTVNFVEWIMKQGRANKSKMKTQHAQNSTLPQISQYYEWR